MSPRRARSGADGARTARYESQVSAAAGIEIPESLQSSTTVGRALGELARSQQAHIHARVRTQTNLFKHFRIARMPPPQHLL